LFISVLLFIFLFLSFVCREFEKNEYIVKFVWWLHLLNQKGARKDVFLLLFSLLE
jgi:hypothetical protein